MVVSTAQTKVDLWVEPKVAMRAEKMVALMVE